MGNRAKDIIEGVPGAFLIAVAILTPFIRYWRYWGSTEVEVNRNLPGDELIPHPKAGFTQAITIRAPRYQVWPWVAQLGQDRGGFYSYDFLENLVGCNIHSLDRIVEEYEHTETSKGLRIHPEIPPIPLAAIEPQKMLLFSGKLDPDSPTSWLFYLDEVNGSTRLIDRWLFDYRGSLVNKIVYYIVERISWVMGRKMLLGIKKRVETATERIV